MQRAPGELGIKIDRRFRFFQDKLIKNMRLKGTRDYEEANRFLREVERFTNCFS